MSYLNPELRAAIERWRLKHEALAAFTGVKYVMTSRYIELSQPRRPHHLDNWLLLASAPTQYTKHAESSNSMRWVGNVVPERGHRHQKVFADEGDIHGWFLNNHGEYAESNGEGLVWGVVYQLTAKHGKERFVAGYRVGGEWDVTLDLSKVFVEEERELRDRNPSQLSAAQKAARHADELAEQHAAWARMEEEDDEDQ